MTNTHERAPAGGWRGIAWRVPVFLLLPLVLVDQLAGRWLGGGDADNFRSEHPVYHHGLLPRVTGRSKWGTGEPYPVHTNSLGFIDAAPREVELESERTRLLILGDSFSEGIGVPFEASFAGRLGRELEEVEVLNAAAMSYSPRLHWLKLRYLLEELGLQVDRVLVLIDISDVQDEVLYRKFEPDLEAARRGASLLERFASGSFLARRLRERAQRAQRARDRARYNAEVYPPWLDYFWLDNRDTEPYADPQFPLIRSDWTTDALFENEWTHLGVARAREHMQLIAELCAARGIALDVGVYPWPDQIHRGELDCRQVFLWETFCEERGLGFLNLFPAFAPREGETSEDVYAAYFIENDVHWNAAGHELVARAILDHLDP